MKLKFLTIALLLTTLDFAIARFPNLSQTQLEQKVEQADPDFYR